MNKLRIIIVDDHEIVRQGLKGFLDLSGEFDVVGEGQTGRDVVELAQSLKPDLILMDLMMPEMDGIEATRRIKETDPDARILILSSFAQRNQVIPTVKAGASGYVLKDIPPNELITALKDVYRGRTPLHPDIAGMLIEQVQDPKSSSQGYSSLTDRERDVFQLIAKGMSNKEIATDLFISLVTVKTHVSRILSKLELDDRTQVAIFAFKNGLVTESD
jgi:DNA-binding NarL/FixJ family response regulator